MAMSGGNSVRRYQDLRVSMSADGEGAIQVQLQAADATDPVDGRFFLPFNSRDVSRAVATSARLSEQYIARSLPTEAPDLLKDIGARLFAALFEGRRKAVYDRCLNRARDAGECLRIRLSVRSDSVRPIDWIPWEFLYDARRPDFVALSMVSPIVRQGTPSLLPSPRPIKLPARILVVGAEIDPGLGVASEIRWLRALFAEHADLVDVTYIEDATPEVFLSALRDNEYHVLQFIGTGVPPGQGESTDTPDALGLVLMRPEGSPAGTGISPAQVVTTASIIDVIREKQSLLFVLLDACFCQGIAAQLASFVPAVLGVRGSLTARVCDLFVPELYRSLLHGESLESAVTEARQQIDRKLPGSREWGLITLFLQTEDSVIDWKLKHEALRPDNPSFLGESLPAGQTKLRVRLNLLSQNYRALQERRSRIGPDLPYFLSEQIKEAEESINQIRVQLGEVTTGTTVVEQHDE